MNTTAEPQAPTVPEPAQTPSEQESANSAAEKAAHTLTAPNFNKHMIMLLREDLETQEARHQTENARLFGYFEKERNKAARYSREVLYSRSLLATSTLALVFGTFGGMIYGQPTTIGGVEFGQGAGIAMVTASIIFGLFVPAIISVWTRLDDSSAGEQKLARHKPLDGT